jgi:hypothetical protein
MKKRNERTMNNKRRVSANRNKFPKRPAARKSNSVPTPYLNKTQVRGLLSPGPAAQNTESRGFLPFLDQMGGLDGIMSTMGKIQKMVRMFQQFGPMLNMFNSFGSLLGPKAATTSLHPKREALRAATRKTASFPKPGIKSKPGIKR